MQYQGQEVWRCFSMRSCLIWLGEKGLRVVKPVLSAGCLRAPYAGIESQPDHIHLVMALTRHSLQSTPSQPIVRPFAVSLVATQQAMAVPV